MPQVRTIKHKNVGAVLRAKHTKEGPLSVNDCKEVIGWQEEPLEENWGDDYALKDLYKKKIRLTNNPTNRPFRRPLADRYANEHLRGKWSLNLETIVIDNMGFVLQGQHRLVGLILGEQLRKLDTGRWGRSPLIYETLFGFGVDSSKATANTYDLGAKRSLDDVIYRHEQFGKKNTDKQQRKIAKLLAGAIRLVWLRSGGRQVSFAPHFPHSEALEFYKKHPKILQSVKDIVDLDDNEDWSNSIAELISLSYASALHYLMTNSESQKKSLEFWTQVASGEGLSKGSPILALRKILIGTDAGSGSKRDKLIGVIIKAWLLWIAGESGTVKDVNISHSRKDGDKNSYTEFPRIGGIDSALAVKTEINQKQLLILQALKKAKKEITYQDLSLMTGLTKGLLSKEIMAETKAGEKNPHSLCSRKLVTVAQYEPTNGQKVAPYFIRLKK